LENSLEVTIEKLVYGGEGLARTGEGILLVSGVLPGESVRVEPETAKRGVRRARVLEITKPSPFRISPPCPFFNDCGGCQHQQISYQQQLEWKKAILQECFERIAKLKLAVPIEAISAEPWEYRNRIRLHAQKNPAGFNLGFAKPSSNDICAVTSCAISSPALQRAVAKLASGELFESTDRGEWQMELFATDGDRELLASITSSFPPEKQFGETWMTHLPDFSSVSWTSQPDNSRPGASATRSSQWGDGNVTVRVGDFHFRVSHGSFFQTNRHLLGQMIDTAVGKCRGERALDLYAGVGFFTLPLARSFDHVVAVESHPAASLDLQANAGVAFSKVYPYGATAESFVASRACRQNWDLVLVDPPRHGLATPVRNALIDLRPKELVYVSCDPTTLARDASAFCGAGYQITSIHLIDLFPQTYHLETIVHLAR
jgi:23S rRNA (uracil1939-C5)-methyltransferase